MAKKQKHVAKHRKSGKPAPKLETQGRGDPNPPTQTLYDTKKPDVPETEKSYADLVKDWFTQAKESGKPNGEWLGVKDQLFDVKDYTDTLEPKEKK